MLRAALAMLITTAACGVGAAAFLTALDLVTAARSSQPLFVWCLPAIGLLLGAAIDRYGALAAGGMGLVIDALVDGVALPPRLAPQVVIGTLLTHLGGGSAGREGTAVQMGAGVGDLVARGFGLSAASARRALVAVGVAGGFGAVFGTPWAGALFALEVPVLRRLQWKMAPLTVGAAVLGDLVARACGATHTALPASVPLAFSVHAVMAWCIVGLVVAAVTVGFVVCVGGLKGLVERHLPSRSVRLAVGGVAMVALWRAWGDDAVLGLGVPSIVASVSDGELSPLFWLAKAAATIVTVGCGFVGGEVTPLFAIGAGLGHALSSLVELPAGLTAAVCMCALLATATRTPLAIVVMGLELFGVAVLPHLLLVVVVARWPARRFGIYGAQRSPCADAGLTGC